MLDRAGHYRLQIVRGERPPRRFHSKHFEIRSRRLEFGPRAGAGTRLHIPGARKRRSRVGFQGRN